MGSLETQIAAFTNLEALEGLKEDFSCFVRARGFADFGLHLYSVWNPGDRPDISVTSLGPSEHSTYAARLAPVLGRRSVETDSGGGAYWWSDPSRDEVPMLMIPCNGDARERALVTLIPLRLSDVNLGELVDRSQTFYQDANRALQSHGFIEPFPRLSKKERLVLTLQATGRATPERLQLEGFTRETFAEYLETATRSLKAENPIHAVVVALRLGLVAA